MGGIDELSRNFNQIFQDTLQISESSEFLLIVMITAIMPNIETEAAIFWSILLYVGNRSSMIPLLFMKSRETWVFLPVLTERLKHC